MPKFRTTVDYVSDCTVGDLANHIGPLNGSIVKIVPNGPGGGNVELTIDFPTRSSAIDFLAGHEADNIGDDDSDAEIREWLGEMVDEVDG